jgi:hypothetical protein
VSLVKLGYRKCCEPHCAIPHVLKTRRGKALGDEGSDVSMILYLNLSGVEGYSIKKGEACLLQRVGMKNVIL